MAELRNEEADLIAAYRAEYELAVEQGRHGKARRVAAVLLADHDVDLTPKPTAPEKAVAEPVTEKAVPPKPAARTRKPRAAGKSDSEV